MRRRCNAYGVYGMMRNYAGYGMTVDKAKALLRECREGEHTAEVRKAAKQAAPDLVEWLVLSIVDGKSLHDMEIKWELGEADKMPCCRNSFYAYRKLTLAILDNMLAGKEVGQDGEL